MFEDEAIINDSYFLRNDVVSFNSAKRLAEKLLTYDPVLVTSSIDTVERIQKAASWQELRNIMVALNVAMFPNPTKFIGYVKSE